MEKTLIFFDEKKYKIDVSDIKFIGESLQHIIDKWNALKLDAFKSTDLQNLLNDTEAFWYEQHIKGTKFANLRDELEEDELRKLIKKPAAFKELAQLVEKFQKTLENRAKLFEDEAKDYFSFFEFGDNGQVQLIESAIEELMEKRKWYAETEKSQLIFETIKKITAVLNDADIFNNTGKIATDHQFAGFFSSLINFDMSTQKMTINYDAVKRYDNVK